MNLIKIAARVAAKSVLDTCREQWPGQVPDVGELLGTGANGEVYSMGSGLVAKFSSSYADASMPVQGPGIVKVHEVRNFGKHGGRSYFMVVMDRLSPLEPSDMEGFEYFPSLVSDAAGDDYTKFYGYDEETYPDHRKAPQMWKEFVEKIRDAGALDQIDIVAGEKNIMKDGDGNLTAVDLV